MRLALCQLNPPVGDPMACADRILQALAEAAADGAELAITGECAIGGYPADDLWLMPSYLAACKDALDRVAAKAPLPVLVGVPRMDENGHRRNSAAFILPGRGVVQFIDKSCLPNYDVFDEARYFVPGQSAGYIDVPRIGDSSARFAVSICEDLWDENGPWRTPPLGAIGHINLSASPYKRDRVADRAALVCGRAEELGIPVVLCNLVGAQDQLIFDGASCVADGSGVITERAPFCASATVVVDLLDDSLNGTATTTHNWPQAWEEEVWLALRLGVRDYATKSGFERALVGLSGGIDSAVVLALAVDAFGVGSVRAITMPSQFTSDATLGDAKRMAEVLGISLDTVSIGGILGAAEGALDAITEDRPGIVHENLQARIRGLLLMAESNRDGSMVLATSNKSESAVGYATLYGDMVGAVAPIADVFKTDIWALARWRNDLAQRAGQPTPIPESIITREPTAELRHDQRDTDSLPPYDVLDAILALFIEDDVDVPDVVARGFSQQDAEHVARLLIRSQYKRAQASVVLRVSHRGFGRDWRRPIVCARTTWSEHRP